MAHVKGFKVATLNVRSLANKIPEIQNLFVGFQVICLCETWLDKHTPDVLLNIEGYTLFRLDRSSNVSAVSAVNANKRGGDLCIYIKDKFAEYTTVLWDLSNVNDDIEQLWIRLSCPNIKRKYIGCVYRPPRGKIP